MTAILKNDFFRLLSRRYYVIITLTMIVASVFLAVYFTARFEVRGSVAVIGAGSAQDLSSKYISFTPLRSAPPLSELVMGRYDAVATKTTGGWQIVTVRGAQFKRMVASALRDPAAFTPPAEKGRQGPGVNILGYLLMFLMLQGVLFMFPYAEDRERRQLERIAASPLPFSRYLLGHCLFVFIFLIVPAFVVLTAAKYIFRLDIGFSLPQYLLLLAVIAALSTAFGMFINSVLRGADTANMAGSSVVVLTSMLAGSFNFFGSGGSVFETVIKILPQKDYLAFAQGLENGSPPAAILPGLCYVLIFTVLLFLLAVAANRRNYYAH